MKKQEFKVTLNIKAEIESSGKPFLTETRVKRQIEKFLKGRSMTEGLACHGTAEIAVTDVIEYGKY